MTGSPYWLLVGGAWVQLDGVDPGISTTADRPRSETVSLGGVRRTQRAARAPRTWGLSFTDDLVQAPRYLSLAAQGLVGDVFLYDAAAAQVNMLTPADTMGATTMPTITASTIAMPIHETGKTITMRLRAGVTYHFSGNTNHVPAATLGTYDIGAGAVDIVAPAGLGSRRFSASCTPATAVTATFTINRTTTVGSTALRLTEGSVDNLGFVPGKSAVCQVSVLDGEEILSQVYTDRLPLSSYSFTLLEVGS